MKRSTVGFQSLLNWRLRDTINSIMPKYKDFTWEDYQISLKPKGLRGIRIFHWIPYLSGSDISLVLSVKTKFKQKRIFKCQTRCNRYDGQNLNYIDSLSQDWSPDNTPTAIYKEEIKKYLVVTGEYQFMVSISDGGKSSTWEMVANFTLFERDKIVINFLFPVFTLILGAFLSWLIQWLLTN